MKTLLRRNHILPEAKRLALRRARHEMCVQPLQPEVRLLKRREFLSAPVALAVLTSPLGARQIRPAGSARVAIDPRVELMSIVHLLGDYALTGEADTAYKKDAAAHFGGYRSHPVVAMAKAFAETTLSFDAVPDLILRLTNPDALAWRTGLAAGEPWGIPNAAERERFVSLLRDFATASNFGGFFKRNQRLYRSVARSIEPFVNPTVTSLEAYVGASLGKWQVIPGLLMLDGGFGPKLSRADGALETYALIGPLYDSPELPNFGDYDRLQNLVVHELAHSLINPLTEQHAGLVQNYAGRFDANLRAAMLKQGAYDDWETVVNEHIIRAITTRIAKLIRGDSAGDMAFAEEVKRGYVYVPALVDQLKAFETDRAKWPDLRSYYPQLLTAFE